ncbi:MAG: hypothetical protein JNK29_12760 [Anaerolineales bacterium]|nr:hypothetical protein [Anaerolineales bacterium]
MTGWAKNPLDGKTEHWGSPQIILAPTEAQLDGEARPFRLAGARGAIGFIYPLSQLFCACCTRKRLTANGKLRPSRARPRAPARWPGCGRPPAAC